jgi:hypothetical protein
MQGEPDEAKGMSANRLRGFISLVAGGPSW